MSPSFPLLFLHFISFKSNFRQTQNVRCYYVHKYHIAEIHNRLRGSAIMISLTIHKSKLLACTNFFMRYVIENLINFSQLYYSMMQLSQINVYLTSIENFF